jgi:hypothetical protein
VARPKSKLRYRIYAIATAGSVLVATLASAAMAAPMIPVLTAQKAGEFQPARGSGYLAWEQNTRAHPRWFNVLARRDGGKRFRVNRRGSQGAMGGIDGNTIVYQEFKRSNANIRFYNLTTGKRTNPAIYVNTRGWEYWPSISGDWVLFGRRNLSATRRKIILYNRATLNVRVIDETTNAKSFISPGQINGDYVVWHRCRPVPNCNVFRYNIRTRLTRRIPRPPNSSQHAASVTPDGTVYFARSRRRCGRNVRLMRFPLGGPARVLATLSAGRDAGDSFAVTEPDGNHFYFERNVCNKPARSDILKIIDRGPA